MANKEDQPTKDSQRALPRNRRMRGVTHQPDSTPRAKVRSTEAKRVQERQAGQRDMFEDPIPDSEIKYYQPLLTGWLHIVDLARNMVVTNRQRMVHGAA